MPIPKEQSYVHVDDNHIIRVKGNKKIAHASRKKHGGVVWYHGPSHIHYKVGEVHVPSVEAAKQKQSLKEAKRLTETCQKCDGEGEIDGKECPKCHGDGMTIMQPTLSISEGVKANYSMRYKTADQVEIKHAGYPIGHVVKTGGGKWIARHSLSKQTDDYSGFTSAEGAAAKVALMHKNWLGEGYELETSKRARAFKETIRRFKVLTKNKVKQKAKKLHVPHVMEGAKDET